MGGRYLITGVQIAIVKALTRTPDALSELNTVLEKQFVFDSEDLVEKDVIKIRKNINMVEDDGK